MINITFNGVTAEISGVPEEIIEALKYSFSILLEEEIYEEIKLKSNFPIVTSYGGARHLLEVHPDYIRIPTGLLPRVTRKLKELGLSFQIEKGLQEPARSNRPLGDTLRPHQTQAVTTFLKHKRGYIEAPTRSGKSYIIAEFFNQFADEVIKVVYVPTKNLLYQMQGDVADYLQIPKEEIGLLGDGKCILKPITIAIPNTVIQKVNRNHQAVIDHLNQVQVVIYDECHRYCNPTGAQINSYTPNAVYKAAVSATPWTHELLIESFTGPKLLTFKAEDMIEQSFIMQPIIRFYEAPAGSAPKRLLETRFTNFKDPKIMWAWNQLTDYLIVNNEKRNQLAARIAKELIETNKGPILILVKKVNTTKKSKSSAVSISHAEILQEILKEEYDIELPIIHGLFSMKQRQEMMDDLAANKIPGMIASAKILSEGVTIPNLTYVMLMSAGSGQIDFVQRIGRALGIKEHQPIIVDFIDPIYPFSRQSEKRIACAEEIYPGSVELVNQNGEPLEK